MLRSQRAAPLHEHEALQRGELEEMMGDGGSDESAVEAEFAERSRAMMFAALKQRHESVVQLLASLCGEHLPLQIRVFSLRRPRTEIQLRQRTAGCQRSDRVELCSPDAREMTATGSAARSCTKGALKRR